MENPAYLRHHLHSLTSFADLQKQKIPHEGCTFRCLVLRSIKLVFAEWVVSRTATTLFEGGKVIRVCQVLEPLLLRSKHKKMSKDVIRPAVRIEEKGGRRRKERSVARWPSE